MGTTRTRTTKTIRLQSDANQTALPVAASPAPSPARTPAEQAIVDAWRKRGRDPQLPKIKGREKEISPVTSDHELWAAQMADLMKTDDAEFLLHLLSEGLSCIWKTEGNRAFNLTLAGVAGIAPRDLLEILLAIQMLSVHHAGMELLRRTMLDDQTTDGVTIGVKRATSLFRTFTAQMDTLMRYRGGGKQVVTVQHVQVDAGGQAIVGTVNHSSNQPRGGRDEAQK